MRDPDLIPQPCRDGESPHPNCVTGNRVSLFTCECYKHWMIKTSCYTSHFLFILSSFTREFRKIFASPYRVAITHTYSSLISPHLCPVIVSLVVLFSQHTQRLSRGDVSLWIPSILQVSGLSESPVSCGEDIPKEVLKCLHHQVTFKICSVCSPGKGKSICLE